MKFLRCSISGGSRETCFFTAFVFDEKKSLSSRDVHNFSRQRVYVASVMADEVDGGQF